MTRPIRRRWQFKPGTLELEPVEGDHPAEFTVEDIEVQEWPPCPTCGETIRVEFDDVTALLDDGVRKYIMGNWHCPNDCYPITGFGARG